MRPLPKLSGSRQKRFTKLRSMKEAAIAPPGVMPSQQPIRDERTAKWAQLSLLAKTTVDLKRLSLRTTTHKRQWSVNSRFAQHRCHGDCSARPRLRPICSEFTLRSCANAGKVAPRLRQGRREAAGPELELGPAVLDV